MIKVHVCLERILQCDALLVDEAGYFSIVMLIPCATIYYSTFMGDVVPDDIGIYLYGI